MDVKGARCFFWHEEVVRRSECPFSTANEKLQSMIHSLFQKELTEGEVMAVIKKLVREKFITVSKEENIGYS